MGLSKPQTATDTRTGLAVAVPEASFYSMRRKTIENGLD